MISHKYRCIFIHQRKAAGTTIIRSFGFERSKRRLPFVNLPIKNWHIVNDGVLSQDPSWDVVRRKFGEYFVFSVVRNPWSKAVSAWKFCRSTRDREFLDVLEHPPKEGVDYRHFTRPQVDILQDEVGELVTNALIRFEDLQLGYDKVCDAIGKPRSVLPVVRQTIMDDYRSYYCDETRERVGSMFETDILRFDYRFDP